jgi:hypothetical protein
LNERPELVAEGAEVAPLLATENELFHGRATDTIAFAFCQSEL